MFFTKLRDREQKVVFKHEKEEVAVTDKNGKKVVATHPRRTICKILDKTTNTVVAKGAANCAPGDNFEYSRGRKLALKRALDTIDFTRAERKAVWDGYLNM